MKLVDAHMHLDVLLRHHPSALQRFEGRGVALVSWAYREVAPNSVIEMVDYFRAQRQILDRARRRLACRFMVGIHPRNIPKDLKPERVGELLEPWLDFSACAGIGEIGLETLIDTHQVEIFQAQLQWILKHAPGKVVGIHTPRHGKHDVTTRTLQILASAGACTRRTIIDHANPQTIDLILEKGFFAGISVSPNKTSIDQAVVMILKHTAQADQIMCNTDSLTEPYDHLYTLAQDDRIDMRVREQVLLGTARDLLLTDEIP